MCLTAMSTLASQIRYRPCYLQDTVMRPGTQTLLLHRPLQQPFRIRRQLAVSPNLLCIHLGIGKDLSRSRLCRPFRPFQSLPKTGMLPLPRRQHPIPYLLRALRRRPTPQLLILHSGHLNMNIDPVQQRPTHLRHIPLNHRRRADTLPRFIVEIPTRTGIHRRRQHKPRRKAQTHRRPRNRHMPVLQRLSQHLQHIPRKLRQLIQKKQTIVRQRNLARPRHHASANQPGVGNRMVWRPERPMRHQPLLRIQHARDRMNLRRSPAPPQTVAKGAEMRQRQRASPASSCPTPAAQSSKCYAHPQPPPPAPASPPAALARPGSRTESAASRSTARSSTAPAA